ncbi:hypothetical protein LUZ60_013857 [Juncus effusus]|nr:hypothetical protein LUZ60_013857 [Juncus effusus]
MHHQTKNLTKSNNTFFISSKYTRSPMAQYTKSKLPIFLRQNPTNQKQETNPHKIQKNPKPKTTSKMEGIISEGSNSTAATPPPYSLPPSRFLPEDVLFCVDVGAESRAEMRVSGPKGRVVTRLDAIRQALLLFVHSKLTMCSDHRFAFSVFGQNFNWVKREFSNDINAAIGAVRLLEAETVPNANADITPIFKVATSEAKKSRTQGRLFRLVLIYCRSSSPPTHQWPANLKTFTMDALYLHDKPSPANCPQRVYDSLVDALEHVSEYEGYVFESGQGLTRVLFRQISVLLAHPMQRCVQDDLDVPKSLVKHGADGGDDVMVVVAN